MAAGPSPFFHAQSARVREAASRGPGLDLACGRGRHALAAAALGLPCLGIDRDPAALGELARAARAAGLPAVPLRADLETGRGIPVRAGSCGAVFVFRFLFRPLAPEIAEVLAPGGLLLYETFTAEQRRFGYGPRNPDFLLEPGELPTLFADLEPLAHWEGISEGPRPEALACLAARRPR